MNQSTSIQNNQQNTKVDDKRRKERQRNYNTKNKTTNKMAIISPS